ncbi:helix-turn-helix domain-containing protein [Vallitalea guaymasensis]|uniref:helix-turn-helix domain-containing protein n=1 Tax=Vallitalea guaymasensis TaxID=1185412 RepID=UPI002357A0EF|nr:helix-turn-helix transcriptional regulator [Vallitalea guaymasensis]
MSENIGIRLSNLLKEKGLSAEDLGNMIGTTKNTIYNIIKGKNTKLETIENISKTLDISIDYLVFGSNQSNDALEEQLIENFRQLNYDNKIEIVGETTKLLTKQKLEKSR